MKPKSEWWKWVALLASASSIVLSFDWLILRTNAQERAKTQQVQAPARVRQYEVFDGQVYNGKFYPKVDIIEWGEPSTMNFQVYWKGHPVHLSFELEETSGKKVMLVHYEFAERKEHLCRRVTAPHHFAKGFKIYRDTSDFEMDNTILSMAPLPPKRGLTELKPTKYLPCEEPKEEDSPESPSGTPQPQARPQAVPPAIDAGGKGYIAPPGVEMQKFKTDDGAIKKKSGAAPFSDW